MSKIDTEALLITLSGWMKAKYDHWNSEGPGSVSMDDIPHEIHQNAHSYVFNNLPKVLNDSHRAIIDLQDERVVLMEQAGILRELLTIAIADWDDHNGRLTDRSCSHWTAAAEAALSLTKGEGN